MNFESRIDLSQLQEAVSQIRTQIGKVIVGQQQTIDLLLTAILADGHILLEGVPGVAKTLMAKLLSKTIAVQFNRIQFTPDLMPSDVIGTAVFNPKTTEFDFKQGPIFSNVVLIDEINRSPAKTQAALFEVMEERQITTAGHTYQMDYPFIVIATQNPIEQEGTYPLPEAQLDRFMFAIKLDYPSFAEEVQVVKSTTSDSKVTIDALFTAEEIIEYQNLIRKIPVTDHVIEYAVTLVSKTRPNNILAPELVKNYLDWGAGPRASQSLILAAKTHAAINGKFSPDIEDVQAVAFGILRHRIVKNYKADAEGITEEDIIQKLF